MDRKLLALVYNKGDIENTRTILAIHFDKEMLADMAVEYSKKPEYDKEGFELYEADKEVLFHAKHRIKINNS